MTSRRLVLKTFVDDRGSLLPIEFANPQLPFVPVRTFVIWDVPGEQHRAGHTVTCDELLVLVRGALAIVTHDGDVQTIESLNHPGDAVLITKGSWLTLRDFARDAVLLVLAAGPYVRRTGDTMPEGTR